MQRFRLLGALMLASVAPVVAMVVVYGGKQSWLNSWYLVNVFQENLPSSEIFLAMLF